MTAHDRALHGGSLLWGIKASLLDYVRGMGDGTVEASGGASVTDVGIRFPSGSDSPEPGSLAFRGAVTLTAHGGMLHVTIADPAIVETSTGWALEIVDPHDASRRMAFATIAGFDGRRATGTALTHDGADLFFGPYQRGTAIDDPSIID
ncbi:HtaA domain-containing protein [Agrococcus sp. DT81.2]|uniref:HtaA domain-containing protein n=1 Tax=Agrococcus sp. DT81.2 TaxID=3393414 RepID=UPI003CE4E817